MWGTETTSLSERREYTRLGMTKEIFLLFTVYIHWICTIYMNIPHSYGHLLKINKYCRYWKPGKYTFISWNHQKHHIICLVEFYFRINIAKNRCLIIYKMSALGSGQWKNNGSSVDDCFCCLPWFSYSFAGFLVRWQTWDLTISLTFTWWIWHE